MMRLFTALEIPATLALELSLLRGGLPGAHWISPENYHLTLRFIGEVEPRAVKEIAEALSRVLRAPFSVTLQGFDCFGGRQPHTLLLRAAATPHLIDLHNEHERIMQRLGLPPEGRRFTPHVTLARLRGTRGSEAAAWLERHGGFFLPAFQISRFVLYASRTLAGGGPYRIEEAYPLAA